MNNEQSIYIKYFIENATQFPTADRASSESKLHMVVGKSGRNSLIPG